MGFYAQFTSEPECALSGSFGDPGRLRCRTLWPRTRVRGSRLPGSGKVDGTTTTSISKARDNSVDILLFFSPNKAARPLGAMQI